MDKTLKTKDKLILTTIDTIAKEGLKNATAGNIAERGDLNKSIIFYYFKNLDDLLKQALYHSIENTLPILEENFQDYNSIEDYLNESIENIISHKDKLIYLKVILSFAHLNIHMEDDLSGLRPAIITDILLVLTKAFQYFSLGEMEVEDLESSASLTVTTFNGLGVLLLSEGANEKFLRNWKLYTSMLNTHIEKKLP